MKRHSFDALSLVFGLIFAGLGILYLSDGVDVADLVTRFWPAALVMLGLAMLLSARRPEEVPAAVLPPVAPAWQAPPPRPAAATDATEPLAPRSVEETDPLVPRPVETSVVDPPPPPKGE